MRKLIVITICIMNAALAVFILWYVLRPSKNTHIKDLSGSSQSSVATISNDELWAKASGASNTREATYYLEKFENKDELEERSTEALHQVSTNKGSDYLKWPFQQALLSQIGINATNIAGLALLRQIAEDESIPLTLRDTAFRSYIENYVRIETAPRSLDDVFSLIDTLYMEPNSLHDVAIQAEHFLAKNWPLPDNRINQFKVRLKTELSSESATESTRILALNILVAMNAYPELPLDTVYLGAGTQLQNAILETLAQKPAGISTDWLRSFRPKTPNEEILIRRILE